MDIRNLKQKIKALIRRNYVALNNIDRKLEKYLNFSEGFFVELGANDGITQSNTYFFEKSKGWRGVLVEPIPHNYLKCHNQRTPKSKVFCAACVPFEYTKEFVRISYSGLMSIAKDLNLDISDPQNHITIGATQLYKDETTFEFGALARTLNSILLEAQAPKKIDLLSLDVEGAEIDVLRGVDHEVFRFEYLLVESRNFEKLNNFLNSHRYTFLEKLSEHDYLFKNQNN